MGISKAVEDVCGKPVKRSWEARYTCESGKILIKCFSTGAVDRTQGVHRGSVPREPSGDVRFSGVNLTQLTA